MERLPFGRPDYLDVGASHDLDPTNFISDPLIIMSRIMMKENQTSDPALASDLEGEIRGAMPPVGLGGELVGVVLGVMDPDVLPSTGFDVV